MEPAPGLLNENQQRRLRVTCEHIDGLFGEIEAVLNAASSRAAFPRYLPDLPPATAGLLSDAIAAARGQLLRVLAGQGMAARAAGIPASRSIHTTLTFIDIAAEELGPKYMRGYGPVAAEAETELLGIVAELRSLVARMDRLVADTGPDWPARLARLEQAGHDTALLGRLERIISAQGLIELRPALGAILDRMEDERFEIALFGRVSSGKSSLLNAILGAEILPVGVTPITAVPTRIVHGEPPRVHVWRVDHPREEHSLSRLASFISEDENPANRLHVSRVLIEFPAPRLSGGVSFVDTPGLGSLALAGGAETLAYLPRCDFAVMLVDAASTLTPDDLGLARRLWEAGIEFSVLLSKADLAAPAGQRRLVDYIASRLQAEVGGVVPVVPVSVAAGQEALLDAWFEQQIAPLYARSRQLRRASLARKTGLLRQAVETGLRARLRQTAAPDRSAVERAEAELRHAAAGFEPARRQARDQAERLAGVAPALLAAAARAALAAPEGTSAADRAALSRAALVAEIQQAGASLAAQLGQLAGAAAAAVQAASAAMGARAGEDLNARCAACLRELPAPEIPAAMLASPLAPPSRLLGRAEARLRAQLERQYGEPLAQLLAAHSALLAGWVERASAALEREFNAAADPLRAQARSLLAAPAGGPQRLAMEQALVAIRAQPAPLPVGPPA